MSVKHLVDLDEEALAAARLALGTRTIRDTVNRAMAEVAARSRRQLLIGDALSRLAAIDLTDESRAEAWR